MCKEIRETWLCKHCFRVGKSQTYVTRKCKSRLKLGICKAWNGTKEVMIDMFDPDCPICNQPRKWPPIDLDDVTEDVK
jgi:hypothetical protein